MAQPPRRLKSTPESRRKTMESASQGSPVVNGVASVKSKVSKGADANGSPYSQSVGCTSAKPGHGKSEMTRRVSTKDKPAVPVKPPPSKVPPPRHQKAGGATTTITTTTVHSKSQSQVLSGGKRDMENRVNGADVKRNGDVNMEAKTANGKGKVCLEITLEKKVSTPTSVRKKHDRDLVHSSSEESSPSQSPSKAVHFKSSRSSSMSSTDSKDWYKPVGPRYQSHTISSADKIQGRTKSATVRTGSGSETGSDTQLNGSSCGGSVDPIKRGRARSLGPIRRVRSNEMMPIKKDLSPPSKSGTANSQVRSRSVERSKNRQSFGGFVQRQRQAWEERVTTVTKRLGHVTERKSSKRTVDPNHAPKIMQKSVTVTERKHMLFGKGASVQKVKNTMDENQVNRSTSPTSPQNKSDVSHKVPKTKSSSSNVDVCNNAKTETNVQVVSKGIAQDDILKSDHNRTVSVDSPPEKPSVLQEIAPSPSSKPNAPSSLPLKLVHHHSETNHRTLQSKENNIDTLVLDVDPFNGNGTDEVDNGKHLFIHKDPLIGKPETVMCKQQQSSDCEQQEGYSELLGLADPKEINKLNSETLQSLKKADNTFLSVDKKDAGKKDRVKEQEKAGISNGEDVGEKDGHYFVKVVNEEQSRIEALCRKVEEDLELELPDEASGICRAFLGKANLLTSKKFKQFRGLCEQNITDTPSLESGKSPTSSDLAGFWDMVLIQVDDIHSKFIDIESMKENNWKVVAPPPTVTKPTPHKAPSKRSYTRQVSRDKDKKGGAQGKATADSKKKDEARAAKMRAAREEARRRLMEAKKQAARQRIRSSNSETEVEIYTAGGQQQ